MASYVSFGDAEAAVVDILRAAATVDAFNPLTVSTDLRGYIEGARWVRVWRSGGVPTTWMHVDNAVIDVEVSAENKAAALDIASAARGAIFAATGYTGHGLSLYDVSDTGGGLRWTPEATIARYAFTVSLVTRPL